MKVGDKVAEGTVVLEVEAAGAAAAPAPAAAPAAAAPAKAAEAAKPAAAAAPAPAASAGPVEIQVPDIGDFKEVEVIEVMVAVGDTIKAEQSLITVESDKASMEIPLAGRRGQVKVKVGDKVAKGSVVVVVEGSAPAAAARPGRCRRARAGRGAGTGGSRRRAGRASGSGRRAGRRQPEAGPAAARFALGAQVRARAGRESEQGQGSGPKDRITADDVRAFVKQALAAPAAVAGGSADGAALGLLPWPKVDFTKFGPIEAKPLSRIKKISGANLHRNWVMIPHVTNNDEADITDLEALRVTLNKENEKSGIKVTMLAFLIKAVVAALKKFPEFNASLDGDNLVLKQYYHIGFAADTPTGWWCR